MDCLHSLYTILQAACPSMEWMDALQPGGSSTIPFHISLSKTVYLKEFHIHRFIQLLTEQSHYFTR